MVVFEIMKGMITEVSLTNYNIESIGYKFNKGLEKWFTARQWSIYYKLLIFKND